MKNHLVRLIGCSAFAFGLLACQTYPPLGNVGPMRFQGVKFVKVDVDITDQGTTWGVSSADDNTDGNNDNKRQRVQERATYIQWRFTGLAQAGGVAKFNFLNHSEYDFTCNLLANRQCESNTFVIPCGSTANRYEMKYAITYSDGGKTGTEDPWVEVEK